MYLDFDQDFVGFRLILTLKPDNLLVVKAEHEISFGNPVRER